jgi:predicted small secreted protein
MPIQHSEYQNVVIPAHRDDFISFAFCTLIIQVCRRGPEKMIRKVLLVIVFAGIVLSLAGCKTVQGIGGDITWLGKKGEQAIER